MRCFLSILTFWVFSAAAQPQLKAELSRNMTGEDLYTIEYTIEGVGKVTSFTPPSFKDLKLLRGPEQTQGYSLVNGELQPYVNFIYMVSPKRSGRIHVDEAVAVADGKTIRSGALEIYTAGTPMRSATDVTPGELEGYLLRKGERAEDKIRGNLFVRLSLSRTKCYVGEAVVAEYKLYTRLNSESKVVRRPSFNGFSVYDMMLQESGAVQRETVGGKVYDVYPLRKVMMYPLQSGMLSLDALEVENQVSFVRPEAMGGGSLADALRAYGEGRAPEGTVVREKVTVSNPVQSVQVLPLPDTGRPANFNGAVGKFTISAVMDHPKVEQGAVSYLDVTVAGQGNLPVIGKPAITWPEGVETFEDSIREEYNQFRSPEHWRKTFTVPFTMRLAGDKVIPSVRLVYFDPDSGRYKTASTEPIRFQVVPATNAGKPEELRRTFWGGQTDRSWLWLPIILVAGMIILFIAQNVRASRKARVRADAERAADLHAQEEEWKHLREQRVQVPLDLTLARQAVEDADAKAFYKAVEAALRQWCADNLGTASNASREERSKAWLDSGRSAGLLEEWHIMLRTAEAARFDPLLRSDGLGDELMRLEAFAARLEKNQDQSVNL